MRGGNRETVTLTSSPLLSKTLLLELPALQRSLEAGPARVALNSFVMGLVMTQLPAHYWPPSQLSALPRPGPELSSLFFPAERKGQDKGCKSSQNSSQAMPLKSPKRCKKPLRELASLLKPGFGWLQLPGEGRLLRVH